MPPAASSVSVAMVSWGAGIAGSAGGAAASTLVQATLAATRWCSVGLTVLRQSRSIGGGEVQEVDDAGDSPQRPPRCWTIAHKAAAVCEYGQSQS